MVGVTLGSELDEDEIIVRISVGYMFGVRLASNFGDEVEPGQQPLTLTSAITCFFL